jgi:diguanylate cyclase (GGDEF)-like protein/PAS domain S-box-containing protein
MFDLDQAARLVADLCGSATAFIVAENALAVVACAGPHPDNAALRLCARAIEKRDVAVAPAPLAASHSDRPPGYGASAAVPLLGPSGGCLGALGVIDCPADTGDGRTELLRRLAPLVAAQLQCRRDETATTAAAEQAAGDGQMRLRSAIEALPDAVVIFDAQNRVVLWNRAFEERYADCAGRLRAGERLEDFLGAGLAPSPPAPGYEDPEIVERRPRDAERERTYERRLETGDWIGVQGRRTLDGGSIVIRPVTERCEESFQLLFAANPVPMFVYDVDSLEFLAVNDAALDFYGYDRAAFRSLSLLDIRPERDREPLRRAIAKFRGNYVPDRTWTHQCADGREVEVNVYAKRMIYEGREAALAAVIDVTERQKAEDELRRTRAFLDSVVDGIPAAVFVKDMRDNGRYVLFNRFGQELVGRSRDDLVGRTDEDVYGPEVAARYRAEDCATMADGRLHVIEDQPVPRIDGQSRYIRTKKLPIADADGTPRFVLGICEDTTERRAIEARVAHMAHHDALTDLPNRLLFRERLEKATLRACRFGERLAVLWLDLDQFKSVNDALGHPTGDALLRAVAERLRLCLRATDTAARFGGDEFAVLQAPLDKPQDAARLASRLLEALSAPYDVDGQQLVVGASIGISLAPQDATDADALLRTADIALYHAKSGGRGMHRFFEASMSADVQARRALETDLRRALAEDQFELWYQPVVDLPTSRISGCEALLRWRHPTRGLVLPSEFIPVAEEIGLIVPLGEWALRRACAEAVGWPPDLKVAVNLSPVQFRQRTLATTVALALAASGLAPHRLELEITESVLLLDNEANLATLRQLQALGTRISLDDFGTGYSSLSYLRSFPFDKIKIDRSFVADLEQSSDCTAIVRAVTTLGKSLGMTTVAEGVETPLQLERLRAEGCREAQGYLFSRPLPAREIAPLLAGRSLVICAA